MTRSTELLLLSYSWKIYIDIDITNCLLTLLCSKHLPRALSEWCQNGVRMVSEWCQNGVRMVSELVVKSMQIVISPHLFKSCSAWNLCELNRLIYLGDLMHWCYIRTKVEINLKADLSIFIGETKVIIGGRPWVPTCVSCWPLLLNVTFSSVNVKKS
jgi:hypothetical protein